MELKCCSILGNLSKLSPTNLEQKTLVNKINVDLTQLNLSFTNLVDYLETAPRNVSVRVLPEFQNNWNLTVTAHQTFGLDASQLSEYLCTQADQLRQTNLVLVIALSGVFGVFFLLSYLITYRHALKSISNLQKGIKSIGSGNLDYSIQTKKEDELAELAQSFNQMATDLKTVTASKADLEKEVVGRKKAEEALKENNRNLELLIEERTKQLKDSEMLAAIGATAGMVGHDIRNPLQAITGDVYLLKEELRGMPERPEKGSAGESLEGIEKNVEYINKIVADLQDFARPLKPRIEEVDLKQIIEDLLAKNGVPQNVKVSVRVEAEAEKILVDPIFISRIMVNLVNNAIQAMPKGGELTINAFKDVNDVLITVKDSGVGIPEKVKDKLFEPMFTTKSKGQGFGLAVIKRMTEALGGKFTFESKEKKGTTFIVRLPPPKN